MSFASKAASRKILPPSPVCIFSVFSLTGGEERAILGAISYGQYCPMKGCEKQK